MRIRSFAAVTALAVASAPLLAAPAQSADTTLGATFADVASCGSGITVLQTGPSAYSAPTAGVITSWRTTSPSTYSAALRVGRLASGTTYSVTAAPAPTTIVGGQPFEQDVRVPVQAGDIIGLYLPTQDTAALCGRQASSDYTYALGEGDSSAPAGGGAGVQLNVAATLESDADGDGYGDTTQDKCPTQATTQGACADTTAPQTTITKVKAAKIKADASNKAKAQVTTTFRANERSTFQCSVDGGRYKACSSPFKVKLAKGKHTIAVQATDIAGNVDKTPAMAKVTVKRAKK